MIRFPVTRSPWAFLTAIALICICACLFLLLKVYERTVNKAGPHENNRASLRTIIHGVDRVILLEDFEVQKNVNTHPPVPGYTRAEINHFGVALGVISNAADLNPGILREVRGIRMFHRSPVTLTSRNTTLRFFYMSPDVQSQRHADATYLPETAQIIYGEEWCNAPAQFQNWISLCLDRYEDADFIAYDGIAIQRIFPKTIPVVRMARRTGSLVLKFIDPTSTDRTGFPETVRACEIAWKAGGEPPRDMTELRRWLCSTPAAGGPWEQASHGPYYFRARWIYADGTEGPWSKLYTFH